MQFEFKVAVKYLLCFKTQTAILILGVMLGVVVFVFITSLISGLSKYWTVQILANIPHIVLERENLRPSLGTVLKNKYKNFEIHEFTPPKNTGQRQIYDWKKIEHAISMHPDISQIFSSVNGQAFLRRNENIQPILIKGILPEKVSNVIKNGMIYGNMYLGSNGLIMGYLSANELGVTIGQPVIVQSEQGVVKILTVQGIFKTGTNFLDRWYAYTDLKTSQILFKTSAGVTSIEIQLKDIWNAEKISNEIKQFFQLEVISWQNSDFGIMEGLKTQTRVGKIIQTFSLLIVMIGILGSLLLSIYRLKPEIGIMRSFGMTKAFVANIFLIQGLLIGTIGSLFGSLIGYLFCSLLFHMKSLNGEPLLPLAINEGGYLIVIVLTIVGSGATALIPAKMAANIDPVECIERR